MNDKGNRYDKLVSSYSDNELAAVLDNQDDYVDEMVLAALNEIEKRRSNVNTDIAFKEKIEERINSRNTFTQEEKARRDNRFAIPVNLPLEIKYACYLLYFSIAISLGELYFFKAHWSYAISIGSVSMKIPSVILIVANVLLVHMGYKWARNLFVGMAIVTLGIVLSIGASTFIDPLNVTQTGLQALAVYLLFSKKARRWYKEEKREFVNDDTCSSL